MPPPQTPQAPPTPQASSTGTTPQWSLPEPPKPSASTISASAPPFKPTDIKARKAHYADPDNPALPLEERANTKLEHARQEEFGSPSEASRKSRSGRNYLPPEKSDPFSKLVTSEPEVRRLGLAARQAAEGKLGEGISAIGNPKWMGKQLEDINRMVPEGKPGLQVAQPSQGGNTYYLWRNNAGAVTDWAIADTKGVIFSRGSLGRINPALKGPGQGEVMKALWKDRDKLKLDTSSMSPGAIKSWKKFMEGVDPEDWVDPEMGY